VSAEDEEHVPARAWAAFGRHNRGCIASPYGCNILPRGGFPTGASKTAWSKERMSRGKRERLVGAGLRRQRSSR